MSEPRIYVLSNELGAGGVPRVIYNVCRHLRDSGMEIRIGYLGGPDELVRPIRELGYEVEKLGNGFPDVRQPVSVYRAISRFDPDILHTHMSPAALLGRPIGKLSETVVVSTFHITYAEYSPFAKVMEYPTSHLCDGIIAVSNAVRESLPPTYALGAEREVIHNCIDTESVRKQGSVPLEELPWGEEISPEHPVIANVARFSKKKAQDDLVAALPRIVERFPDVQLVMTGWGPMKEELSAQARALGVRENTVFLEKVENPYAVYYHADVVAFPSEFEGFSISVLEAMAFGKPLVTTDIAPFVEALGDGYPVAPVGEPLALAERIIDVLSRPEWARERGEELRSRVNERFSGDVAAGKHARFYRDLLSN